MLSVKNVLSLGVSSNNLILCYILKNRISVFLYLTAGTKISKFNSQNEFWNLSNFFGIKFSNLRSCLTVRDDYGV